VCTIVNLRHWVSLAPLFGSVYITVLNCVGLCHVMFIWWFVLYYICTVLRGRYCAIQHSCCNTNKPIIIIIIIIKSSDNTRYCSQWLILTQACRVVPVHCVPVRQHVSQLHPLSTDASPLPVCPNNTHSIHHPTSTCLFTHCQLGRVSTLRVAVRVILKH